MVDELAYFERPDPATVDPFVDVREAARIMGETVPSLLILSERGVLPASSWRKVPIAGREKWVRRWRRASVELFAAERRAAMK